jgi:hypothetical protein
VSKLWLVDCAQLLQVCHAFSKSGVLHPVGVRLPGLICYILLQDYGGAVVVGNDVQASFESCQFLDNGRPLCAEQDFTLVRALIVPFDPAVNGVFASFSEEDAYLLEGGGAALMQADNAVRMSASINAVQDTKFFTSPNF